MRTALLEMSFISENTGILVHLRDSRCNAIASAWMKTDPQGMSIVSNSLEILPHLFERKHENLLRSVDYALMTSILGFLSVVLHKAFFKK